MRTVVAPAERRALILAPMGKDAQLLQRQLTHEEIPSFVCNTRGEMMDEVLHGAGVLLVTEEALLPSYDALASWLARQPAWSDLPLLLLSRSGASSALVREALARLGNVSLLERPVRVTALVSTVRSALRARQRQYVIRQHLLERELANQRKDQFLATLAHELRNPLAPISNCVALLRNQRPGASVVPVCEILERQTRQMVRLVDDLMDVSRITRGKITLREERVDLAEVIETAVETVRPQLDAEGHALELQLPAEPVYVQGDPVRLSQVLSNLLANAAKYTDPGGHISIRLGAEGDEALIQVVDDGIGIPADAIDAVFDLFAQVDAYDQRARGGLGIGLTLARTLIDMHGGRLSAHSDGAGRGSTFEVRLPRADRGEVATPVADPGPAEAIGVRRILVVDDNRDAANSLAYLLGAQGAEVRVAYDAETALETVTVFVPDIAVLDLGMPGMNGFELAQRLRALPSTSESVLIALTGWGQPHDRQQSADAGFDHHLVKPVEWREIEALLAAV